MFEISDFDLFGDRSSFGVAGGGLGYCDVIESVNSKKPDPREACSWQNACRASTLATSWIPIARGAVTFCLNPSTAPSVYVQKALVVRGGWAAREREEHYTIRRAITSMCHTCLNPHCFRVICESKTDGFTSPDRSKYTGNPSLLNPWCACGVTEE
jgi:hypothetical protein